MCILFIDNGSKKVPFSVDQEANLIHEIKNRPLLWDVSHAQYRMNNLKETHWDEIAAVIGPTYIGEAVKEKFAKMKTNFMRNHKRVRDAKNKCSGSGTDDFYKPTWPLYSSLMFLENMCPRLSCSNLDSQASHENAESAILSNIYLDNLQQSMMIPKDVETVPPVPHTDIVSPDESDVSCSGYSTTAIASSQRSSPSVPQSLRMFKVHCHLHQH